MSFFKRFFGTGKQEKPTKNNQEQWIEAKDNEWAVRVLDVRPVTQGMLSTSTDPQMAANAISYGQEDGAFFWQQHTQVQKDIPTTIAFAIDGSLEAGVLFIPRVMEHKWAIFYDGENLIFVRSWLRKVFVVAKTKQIDNQLIIENIKGEFTLNESPEFTTAVLRYLLISHAIGDILPAPVPKDLASDIKKAGLWAFSTYGNMAQFAVFNEGFIPQTRQPLRSHSLLHIAVAKSNISEIEKQVQKEKSLTYLAGDGLAPLHWAIGPESTTSLEKLLKLGADPNVKSTEGATPIMNAVQSNKINHLELLLKAGANVNAADARGFTSLHRAAEMGHQEMVKILLEHGADKTIEANGHTAMSFAKNRGDEKIMTLLN